VIGTAPKAFLSFEVHRSFEKDLYVIYDKTPGSSLRMNITDEMLENLQWYPRSRLEIPWQEIIRHKLGNIYTVRVKR
jgi:hypothetical protein